MTDPAERGETAAWQPSADAGRHLRLMRVSAAMEVKEVAQAAGVSRSHLSNLEACRHRLSPDVAMRVARAILSGAAR